MQNFSVTLIALAGLLSVCSGVDVANSLPSTTTDASGSSPTLQSPSTALNATISGNNVLITRSNIIVYGDQDKRGLVNLIKNMVMKGSSPQDDDALTTQIIAVLGAGNSTKSGSDVATKMVPKIKTALQSREKPVQLRQIIVKLTEMSPKFGAPDTDDA
ncbi:hypothetical protein PRIC1_001507 [Phytophthora ramorum]|uniref:RxLR effector protein n=1 Tax=Phytophthora ramorum TaxID=164328 RepID=H3GCY5_PHYRM|nr:hypothetical protein KRP23_9889 [Phytophthora ramorum]